MCPKVSQPPRAVLWATSLALKRQVSNISSVLKVVSAILGRRKCLSSLRERRWTFSYFDHFRLNLGNNSILSLNGIVSYIVLHVAQPLIWLMLLLMRNGSKTDGVFCCGWAWEHMCVVVWWGHLSRLVIWGSWWKACCLWPPTFQVINRIYVTLHFSWLL